MGAGGARRSRLDRSSEQARGEGSWKQQARSANESKLNQSRRRTGEQPAAQLRRSTRPTAAASAAPLVLPPLVHSCRRRACPSPPVVPVPARTSIASCSYNLCAAATAGRWDWRRGEEAAKQRKRNVTRRMACELRRHQGQGKSDDHSRPAAGASATRTRSQRASDKAPAAAARRQELNEAPKHSQIQRLRTAARAIESQARERDERMAGNEASFAASNSAAAPLELRTRALLMSSLLCASATAAFFFAPRSYRQIVGVISTAL